MHFILHYLLKNTYKITSTMVLNNIVMIISFSFIFFFSVHSNALTFNISSFSTSETQKNIKLEGDTSSDGRDLQLTWTANSTSRATYIYQVPLWNSTTGELADFTTHFSFKIVSTNTEIKNWGGDGVAFFIAPFDSVIPARSGYGCLGLFSSEKALNASMNQIVAVEFDTSYNVEWHDPLSDHVGIDINSIQSVKYITWEPTLTNGKLGNAWVTYNATSHNLSVFLTYDNDPVFDGISSTVWYVVDLRTVLPQMVRVGFSATTSKTVEYHTIYTWTFQSSLGISSPSPSPSPSTTSGRPGGGNRYVIWWAVGIPVVSVVCVACVFLLGRCVYKRRLSRGEGPSIRLGKRDASLDHEFERGTRPQKFNYAELDIATNNFKEKLGEGGFGGVYKGLLTASNTEIAVKKVSAGSQQGEKEYISEVKIISRVRHKNLVQLIGWCHQGKELLLVYEYMPNGSLDSHLFGQKVPLTWAQRYKAALGIASALLYLHEDHEPYVLHRDIKASNVMLDSEFNAKLGDFGLARFVDHKHSSKTTVLAGTIGYLAPECTITRKSSKESDVYSFGVVALEVMCGRSVIEPREEAHKINLVIWAWDLYKRGQLLDAVDARLKMEFDKEQEREMECLMVVGLWCCHRDPTLRPSIRHAVNILKFDVLLSTLPKPSTDTHPTSTTTPVTHSEINETPLGSMDD